MLIFRQTQVELEVQVCACLSLSVPSFNLTWSPHSALALQMEHVCARKYVQIIHSDMSQVQNNSLNIKSGRKMFAIKPLPLLLPQFSGMTCLTSVVGVVRKLKCV